MLMWRKLHIQLRIHYSQPVFFQETRPQIWADTGFLYLFQTHFKIEVLGRTKEEASWRAKWRRNTGEITLRATSVQSSVLYNCRVAALKFQPCLREVLFVCHDYIAAKHNRCLDDVSLSECSSMRRSWWTADFSVVQDWGYRIQASPKQLKYFG